MTAIPLQCLKGEVNTALPASVFCSLQKQNIFRSYIIAATFRYTTDLQSCLLGGPLKGLSIEFLQDMICISKPVLRIRIRPIHMILSLLDPDSDPQVRGTDPDPSQAK